MYQAPYKGSVVLCQPPSSVRYYFHFNIGKTDSKKANMLPKFSQTIGVRTIGFKPGSLCMKLSLGSFQVNSQLHVPPVSSKVWAGLEALWPLAYPGVSFQAVAALAVVEDLVSLLSLILI